MKSSPSLIMTLPPPDPHGDGPKHGLVFQAYMHRNDRWTQRNDDDGEGALLERIDKIDPLIVAKFRKGAAGKSAPDCCQRGVQLAFNPTYETPWQLDTERVRTYKERRGVPTGIKKLESIAVRHLASEKGGNLLEKSTARPSDETTFCGAFFVEKKAEAGKAPLLRVIADAREMNAKMDTSQFSFSLFTLSTLMHTLGSMHLSSRPWYAVVTDFRHWFHQLPLREDLKPHFTFKLAGGDWYQPRAVPMGWVLAPYIAQCCTWTVILGNEDRGQPPDFKGLDVDPGMFANMTSPPPCLPLKSGGMIAVVLDNIAVITPLERVARRWKKRLESQGHRYHAIYRSRSKAYDERYDPQIDLFTLGPPATRPLSSSATAVDAEPTAFATAAPAQPEFFNFIGIDWYWDRHQINVDPSQKMPGVEEERKVWQGTHRDLAKVLGTLLYFFRATEHPMFTPEMQRFRELYKVVTPKTLEGWDEPIKIEDENCSYLLELWDMRRTAKPAPTKSKQLTEWKPGFAACDACLSDRERKISVVLFDTEITNEKQALITDHGHNYIALAELEAILRSVQELDKHNKCVNNIFLIATDNLTAEYWIEKGVANSPEANKLLQQLDSALGGRPIVLTYVASASNVADPGTHDRKLEDEPERITATKAVLKQLETFTKKTHLRPSTCRAPQHRGREEDV
jgi:hypothetical protein